MNSFCIASYQEIIKRNLLFYLENSGIFCSKLHESIKYSLLSGGKFLRPLLTLDFCGIRNGDIQKALPIACCVEIIHTYSLIHDDLPCMDNDSYRRGKLSNHIVYGEDFAVLCGDALISLATEILTSDSIVKAIGEKNALKALRILFCSCGASGMVDGQAMDIFYKNHHDNFTTLNEKVKYIELVNLKKTGKLFGAACSLGALAANVDNIVLNIAKKIGENIGIAYQIIDDLEDKNTDENDLLFDEDVENFFKNKADSLLNEATDILLNQFNANNDSYAVSFVKELELKLDKL